MKASKKPLTRILASEMRSNAVIVPGSLLQSGLRIVLGAGFRVSHHVKINKIFMRLVECCCEIS